MAEGGALARPRQHDSPVAVTRSGPGSLGPPIPQRGLGRRPVEARAARSPSPPLERRRRLAMMARPGQRATLRHRPRGVGGRSIRLMTFYVVVTVDVVVTIDIVVTVASVSPLTSASNHRSGRRRG